MRWGMPGCPLGLTPQQLPHGPSPSPGHVSPPVSRASEPCPLQISSPTLLPADPSPLPFHPKPLACLLRCTKPIVRTLFCLRFFLPQEASYKQRQWLVTYHRAGHTGAAPHGAQRGHQAASVGSWAGLRLVVLADTSGTLMGFSWGRQPERPQGASPAWWSQTGGHRGSEVLPARRRPPEVTEQPAPHTPLVEVNMSPPVQGEGYRLHPSKGGVPKSLWSPMASGGEGIYEEGRGDKIK